MKALTFKPTDKIKFTTTDTFVDDFASYLDSILKYWSENFKDKPLNLTRTSDKSAEILTDNNRDNQNNLYNTLKPSVDKQNTKISETINGYKVEWVKTSTSKPEDKKVEKTSDQKKSDVLKGASTGDKIIQGLFEPVANVVAKGLQLAHHEINNENKLHEEIKRIKELL